MSAFEERPPYGSYAAIFGTFAGLLAAAGALGRVLDRDPQCQTPLDFVVLGAASFKAAHTLSHDEVTSFVRQPFVRGHAHSGNEEPVSGGMEQAIGELVTCTRCVGAWSALGVIGLRLTSPPTARVVTSVLATSAINDFLQAAFQAVCEKANESAARAADAR